MTQLKVKRILMLIMMILGMFTLLACLSPEPIEPDDGTVTITFITGVDGYEIPSIKGNPNQRITGQDDPEREGYIFTGWLNEEGSPYSLTRFPKVSMTLTASWVREGEQVTYTISFITKSSESFDVMEVKVGDKIPTLPIPKYYTTSNTVKTFESWLYEGKVFDLNIMPAKSLILEASWKEGSIVIWFETETELEINPIVANPQEAIIPPKEIPYKEGYTFTGWSYQNKPYIFDKMPNSTIALKANYLATTSTNKNETTSTPKLFINIENNQKITSVTKETYLNTQITLTNTTDEFSLSSVSAEFKGRGNGSWIKSGPKRGYRIKFFEKQSMFGEAESKHWVLLAGANFYDPTMLKTMTAFNMSKQLFTNIDYTSSANWVELYVSGEYRGVYVLAEHQRTDKDRVDINPKYGTADTGFFIEYDGYAANEGPLDLAYFNIQGYKYGFTVKSPDPEDYNVGKNAVSEAVFRAQVANIKADTAKAMTAALRGTSGYSEFETYADVDSFVDMYILHELFKNTDTGWSSFFMYKQPGGKLKAVAPWDFDASAGKNRGDQSSSGIYVAGSVMDNSSHTASELYISLMNVPQFRNAVAARFKVLAPGIESFVNDYLSDSVISTHKETLGQNFFHWSQNQNTEGLIAETDSAYMTYATLQSATQGWQQETIKLRNWLLNRKDWLLNEWK